MDLSTAFLGSLSVNTDMVTTGQGIAKAETAKPVSRKFDSYYDNYRNNRQDTVDDRSKNVRDTGDKAVRKQGSENNRRTADDRQAVVKSKDNEAAENNVQKTDSTEESKSVKETKDVGKESDLKVDTDTEKAELEKNIVSELSKALGISEEDLALIMQELNIQPVELMQNENVVKLVQEYLQLEGPAQMLTASNFTDLVSSVTEAVDEALQQTQADDLASPEMLLQEKAMQKLAVKADDKKEIINEVKEEVVVQDVEETIDIKDVEGAEINVETAEADTDSGIIKTVSDSSGTGNQQQQQSSGNMFNSNQANIGANTQSQTTTDSNANNVTNNFSNLTQPMAQAREASAPQRSEAAQRMETVIQQIAEKMKIDIKFDSKEMNLVLKPESLGSISLKLVSENGGVAAQFVAESQRAKEIIEANMSQLKDALQQQGINVSQLSVEVGSDSQSEQMQQFLNEQAKSGKRIQELLSREGFGEEVAAEIEQSTLMALDSSVGNSVNYQA